MATGGERRHRISENVSFVASLLRSGIFVPSLGWTHKKSLPLTPQPYADSANSSARILQKAR
jgi:hypothetical protein